VSTLSETWLQFGLSALFVLLLQVLRMIVIGGVMVLFGMPRDRVHKFLDGESKMDRFKQFVELLIRLLRAVKRK
jgi:hypothetical protein